MSWYSVVNGDELEQGDVIEQCPVFQPIVVEGRAPAERLRAERKIYDVVVMSQSCDMVKGREKIEVTLLCPIEDLEGFARRVGKKLSQVGNSIRNGRQPRYHLLAASEDPDWERPHRVVDLATTFGVPLALLREIVAAQGDRLRIIPPYREHLAQAFARYYMRVGLPIDIPEF